MTSGRDLEERLAAVDRALAAAPGRLEPDEVAELEAVRAKAGERLARGDRAVVVALGGGTGSGKSSLFNALSGRPLAEVGARRPVTAEPTALAVGDPTATGAVLDWLGVRHRHAAAPDPVRPEGLVLVDLPDHDSVERAHREVVDRFVERVDVLVWVVDPLKYAQRALHASYLRSLAAHAEVTLVVLNRVDQLAPTDRDTVAADLRALLDAEGLHRARVLSTSATTGDGVDELAAVIAAEVASRHAIAARIAADVVTVAGGVAEALEPLPDDAAEAAPQLLAAMGEAVGLGGLAEDAGRAYRQDAREGTRPLLSGAIVALLALVIRPLRRWRTERSRRRAVALRAPVGELPVGVRHALLGLAELSSGRAAPRWRSRLRAVAEAGGRALAAETGRDLERIELTPRRRRWWAPVRLVWTLVELVALTGLGWLVASGVLAWLQLPPLPAPQVTDVLSLPTALLLGGLLAWLVVAWLRARLVAVGAARHRRALGERVAAELRERADRAVLRPLADEVAAIRELAEALRSAAA